jgi:hypothetical protein
MRRPEQGFKTPCCKQNQARPGCQGGPASVWLFIFRQNGLPLFLQAALLGICADQPIGDKILQVRKIHNTVRIEVL